MVIERVEGISTRYEEGSPTWSKRQFGRGEGRVLAM